MVKIPQPEAATNIIDVAGDQDKLELLERDFAMLGYSAEKSVKKCPVDKKIFFFTPKVHETYQVEPNRMSKITKKW